MTWTRQPLSSASSASSSLKPQSFLGVSTFSGSSMMSMTTAALERVRKSAHVNTDLAAHFVMAEIRAMANQFWSAQ